MTLKIVNCSKFTGATLYCMPSLKIFIACRFPNIRLANLKKIIRNCTALEYLHFNEYSQEGELRKLFETAVITTRLRTNNTPLAMFTRDFSGDQFYDINNSSSLLLINPMLPEEYLAILKTEPRFPQDPWVYE